MDSRAGEDAVTAPAPGPTARPAAVPAAPLRRRGVLGAAVSAAALAAAAGCGLDPSSIRWDDAAPVPRRTPDADELARRRAVQAARDLRAACDAATAATAAPTPAQAQVVQEVARQHAQHLAALGAADPTPSSAAVTPTTSPSASASGSPSASPSAPPSAPTSAAPSSGSGVVSPDALVAAHDAARRQAAADAVTVSGPLARLLALVAAARVVQAHRLAGALGAAPPASTPPQPLAPPPDTAGTVTPGPTSPGSTSPGSVATSGASRTTGAPSLRDDERAALEALREGELSAVYGYGVLAARLTGPERTRALAALAEHAASAREVADVLRHGDVEPAPGAPAYELPAPVGTPAEARAVAAGIESALVSLAADLVAVTDGRLRAAAVDLTARRALAAAGWGAAPAAFPGTG